MVKLSQKSLIAKLNDLCRKSLDSAAGLCLSRTNLSVEIEHWLLKLLDAPDSDIAALLRYYEVDTTRLSQDLTGALERLRSGSSRTPTLSGHLLDLVRSAWLVASVRHSAARIRSGHLLLGLIDDEDLSRLARGISRELAKIDRNDLEKDFADIVAETAEARDAASSGRGDPGAAAPGATKTPALDQYTIDLTAAARGGKIDPVLGRDPEIRQIVDILMRRRQNNPILTGEAGVGKTAVVEGFALRVALEDVPPALRGIAIKSLDLGLLQAGASLRGEFEERLKSVIEEVTSSTTPTILFIDEAHTMIGAGGQAGQGDAANLLKPALARGELRTIAATTWAEYKEYFENDAALARRFQVVKVEEPDEETALQMMRGLVSTLEGHHGVRVLDEGVHDAVRLSSRYISDRQLPDKSVSLLDTACARVAIGRSSTPPAVEDCERRIGHLTTSIEILGREHALGSDHEERLAELTEERSRAEEALVKLREQWKEELELVEQIRSHYDRASGGKEDGAGSEIGDGPSDDAGASPGSPEAAPAEDVAAEDVAAELRELERRLRDVQGDRPLMQPCVDADAIAEVVSGWTGIPVGRMVTDEVNTVLGLRERLEERVVGQSHALEAISQSIRTARAGLTDPRRPLGVFLLVGPSGVGKTETAIALAEVLYGGEQSMTVINMSEFKEESKISSLVGTSQGYVGYGKGGVLTEAVRRRPHSVVLLDEIEKANPEVQEIFYQVFDKGSLRDGTGRDIDFRNTIILVTSNAASDFTTSLCEDPDTAPDPVALADELYPKLLDFFKPAFLGRMTVVPYYPLEDAVLERIAHLQLGRIRARVQENYGASFDYADDLVTSIVSRCQEVSSGARNIDRILTRSLLPELSTEFLSRLADEASIERVFVSVTSDGGFAYDIG